MKWSQEKPTGFDPSIDAEAIHTNQVVVEKISTCYEWLFSEMSRHTYTKTENPLEGNMRIVPTIKPSDSYAFKKYH